MAKPVKIEDYTSATASDIIKSAATAAVDIKNPEEWNITLTAKQGQTLELLCGLHVANECLDAQESATKKKIVEYCMDAMVEKYVTSKNRPASPEVYSKSGGKKDCGILFVMQDKFKIDVPTAAKDEEFDNEWGINQCVLALQNAGLSAAKAKKFVESEVQVQIHISFMDLQEMIDGRIGSGRKRIPPTEATRSAGLKLQNFLAWRGKGSPTPLNEQELSAITTKKMEYLILPGMLDRVANYVKTKEDLAAIFAVFQPTLMIRNYEFGMNDTTANRKTRIDALCNSVVTVS